MKKVLCVLLAMVLLLTVAAAQAEDGAPSLASLGALREGGMLPELRYLRVEPVPNAHVLTRVPEGIPLLWEAVSETYAKLSYEGYSGYIYIKDAVAAEVTVQPLAQPYIAYSESAMTAVAQPYVNAAGVCAIGAQTPLRVVSDCGAMAEVELAGQTAFVPQALLTPLAKDSACTPYKSEVAAAQVVLEYPLNGAAVAGVLPEGAAVTVRASNGAFVRVQSGNVIGYIPAETLQKAGEKVALLGYAVRALPCFSRPYASAVSQETIAAGTLLRFDLRQGKYLRVQGESRFVAESDVTLLRASSLSQPAEVYWTSAQTLRTGDGERFGEKLFPAYTLVTATQTVGRFYLVTYDGTLGFLPISGAQKRLTSERLTSAAATTSAVSIRAAASELAAETGVRIPKGQPLWLVRVAEGWSQVVWEDHIGYLAESDVRLLGSDAVIPQREIYLDADAELLDFPDGKLGRAVGQLTANQCLTVRAENGDCWKVTAGGVTGYLPKQDTWNVSDAGSGEVRYGLHLDKSGPTLTVYALDDAGARTDTVVRTIVPAIGKRTTPTPTGVFTLSTRERWHYFGPSFTPFTVAYTSGRYLHGPLCAGQSEAGIKQSHLSDFGKSVTGGCLRMPYEDAMWIYMHCAAGTELEITNGPLAAAE